MKRVLLALLVVAVPVAAAAQKDSGKGAGTGTGTGSASDAGTDVQMEEDDTPPDDMEGTSENPDAPKLGDADAGVTGPAAPKPTRTGYPIEEVLRPLTLPAVTSEVSLDLRSTFSAFDANAGLRARYGITRQVQIGLRYGIGGLFDNPNTVDTKTKFNTGKAVGVDFTYLIFNWLSAQMTIPVYIQPYAMSLGLGAPMKFRFGDKFAIVAGEDIVDIRLTKFIPSLTDEAQNQANVAALDSNSVTAKGDVHIRGGIIYQVSPQLAVKGNLSQSITIETTEINGRGGNPFGLEGLLQYSPSAKMDVSGRLGIDDFSHTKESFGILVAAAYRI